MRKKKRALIRTWAPVLAAVLLLAAAAALLFPRLHRDMLESSRSSIRQAVLRSAVDCYAVEGAYPSSLTYLEENYGLVLNHRDFIISYNAFASNVLPDVQVLVRGEG